MRSIKKNLISVYLVNAVNGVLGIIFVPLAVKLLGISGYGLYSIYGVLVSYVVLIDLGITKNLVRLLAAEKHENHKLLNLQSAFALYIAISIVLLILLPLFLFIVPKYLFVVPDSDIGTLRWIIALAIVEYMIAIPTTMTQWSCVAEERFRRFSLFTFVSGIYRYALMFFGILIFGSPAAVVALVVSRRLIDAFISRWIMGALPVAAFRPRFRFKEMRSILTHSSALSVSQGCQLTVVSIGSILVNKYYGLNGLGIYRASFDLANKVWFISNGFSLVVFPRFVNLLSDKTHRERLYSKILLLLNSSWIGYSLIAILGMLASPWFLAAIGLTQPLTSEMFILLLLGVCWNAHTILSYEFLQASSKYSLSALLSGTSLAAMIISFYIFKNYSGILAIGWAWLVSQCLYAFIADSVSVIISDIPGRINLILFKILVAAGTIMILLVQLDYLSGVVMVPGLSLTAASLLWLANEYRNRSGAQNG
ncbi:MAG: lipopolysaccharide biosynthesis protein [Thermoleophilia bacterium]